MAKDNLCAENKSFLRIMMIIASSDGVLSDDEMQLFYKQGKELRVPPEEVQTIRESITIGEDMLLQLGEECSYISTASLKSKLLRELIALCYADGEYSEQEAAGMRAICSFVRMDLADLEKAEKSFLFMSKSKARIAAETGRVLAAGKSAGKTVGTKIANGASLTAHAIAQGMTTIGSKLSVTIESAKKAKEENKILREKLKEGTITEAVKQKVILKLGNKIHTLSMQLAEEKKRNEQNEEKIALLQAQIDDLKLTLQTAEDATSA